MSLCLIEPRSPRSGTTLDLVFRCTREYAQNVWEDAFSIICYLQLMLPLQSTGWFPHLVPHSHDYIKLEALDLSITDFLKLSHIICCCLLTPMTLASRGSLMFLIVVHQPASPSIWPSVMSLRQGLSTNPGVTMWCVCGVQLKRCCSETYKRNGVTPIFRSFHRTASSTGGWSCWNILMCVFLYHSEHYGLIF